MVFFSHEVDGLSCTKQVPLILVVDFRAATEGALRARRQLLQMVSVDPEGSRPSSRAVQLAIRQQYWRLLHLCVNRNGWQPHVHDL